MSDATKTFADLKIHKRNIVMFAKANDPNLQRDKHILSPNTISLSRWIVMLIVLPRVSIRFIQVYIQLIMFQKYFVHLCEKGSSARFSRIDERSVHIQGLLFNWTNELR